MGRKNDRPYFAGDVSVKRHEDRVSSGANHHFTIMPL